VIALATQIATDDAAAPQPERSLSHRAARLVTEALAPVVIVTSMLLVVGWHAYGSSIGVAWGFAAALFAGIVPFAFIVRGVRGGKLTDRHIGQREQRRVPLLVGLGCIAVGLVAFVLLGVNRELLAALGACGLGLLISLAVNHWWKMSIHTGTVAGAVMIATETFGELVLLALPLIVLVAWSRVKLRDHSLAQTVVGGVVGAVVAGVAFAALR
jgi:hypothetical protein